MEPAARADALLSSCKREDGVAFGDVEAIPAARNNLVAGLLGRSHDLAPERAVRAGDQQSHLNRLRARTSAAPTRRSARRSPNCSA